MVEYKFWYNQGVLGVYRHGRGYELRGRAQWEFGSEVYVAFDRGCCLETTFFGLLQDVGKWV